MITKVSPRKFPKRSLHVPHAKMTDELKLSHTVSFIKVTIKEESKLMVVIVQRSNFWHLMLSYQESLSLSLLSLPISFS